MPHTSHKKGRSPGKREVVGDDGWVKIMPNRSSSKTSKAYSTKVSTTGPILQQPTSDTLPAGGPLEAQRLSSISLDVLKEKVTNMEKMWEQTECHKVLKAAVKTYLSNENHASIETCIMFGGGSLCGVRDGFIERHGTSILQLAVFQTVVNTITKFQVEEPVVYAQEPCYNELDIQYLKHVGITVVEDPAGFELTNTKTFAYTPAAEMPVEIHLLFRNPALFLSNELSWYWRNKDGVAMSDRTGVCMWPKDGIGAPKLLSLDDWELTAGKTDADRRVTMDNECRILEAFVANHDKVRIPDCDQQNFAVHNTCLYSINIATHEQGYDVVAPNDGQEMPYVTPTVNDELVIHSPY